LTTSYESQKILCTGRIYQVVAMGWQTTP